MWMAAIKGLSLSRIAPYVVLGLVASHAVAYGKGSWDGYDKAEGKTLKAAEKAWAGKLERDRKIVVNDAKAGNHEDKIRYKIIYRVAAVPAGQCVFTNECMRFYGATVRAADTTGQDVGD